MNLQEFAILLNFQYFLFFTLYWVLFTLTSYYKKIGHSDNYEVVKQRKNLQKRILVGIGIASLILIISILFIRYDPLNVYSSTTYIQITIAPVWILKFHTFVCICSICLFVYLLLRMAKRNPKVHDEVQRKNLVILILTILPLFIFLLLSCISMIFDPLNIYNPRPSSGDYLLEYIEFIKYMKIM